MEASAEASSSGAERILAAAIQLFGERGFRATSLKAIATEAEVSPALIMHHYGSKERLRLACDEHAAHQIQGRKEEVIGNGQRDPFLIMTRLQDSQPLMRYLTRTLTEGGTHASQLIDEMIADAEDYLSQGEDAGLIKTSAVPRDRAALLVLWSLGALTLHEHVHRLLGADFLAGPDSPQNLERYLRPALELYTQGLVHEGSFEALSAALGTPGTESAADEPSGAAESSDGAEPPGEDGTRSEHGNEKER